MDDHPPIVQTMVFLHLAKGKLRPIGVFAVRGTTGASRLLGRQGHVGVRRHLQLVSSTGYKRVDCTSTPRSIRLSTPQNPLVSARDKLALARVRNTISLDCGAGNYFWVKWYRAKIFEVFGSLQPSKPRSANVFASLRELARHLLAHVSGRATSSAETQAT